jgi:sulfite exporter TauE/SafE
MGKYKKNPVIIFIYAVIEFLSLLAIGIGTLIILILSGIFLSALHVRNFIRKKIEKYNKRP